MLKRYKVTLPIHWKGIEKPFLRKSREIEFDNAYVVEVNAHNPTEATRLAEAKTKQEFAVLHTEERQNSYYNYSYLNDWLWEGDYTTAYGLKAPQCEITAADRKVQEIIDFSTASVETMKKYLTITEFIECTCEALYDKYFK
jgi:hypothetical protein